MMDKADSLDRSWKTYQTNNNDKTLSGLTPARPPKIYEGQDISECLASGGTQVPGKGNEFPKLYSS